MAFPKAQYKLHSGLPQIIEGDKGYYFGATYCTKDLKPVDLLRQPPAGQYSVRQAMGLRGKGLAIQRMSSHLSIMGTPGGVQMTMGITDRMTQPFASSSGPTSGRRFIVTAGGTLCDIDENDVLVQRAVFGTNYTYHPFVGGFVFAENATSLFVLCYGRDVTVSQTASDMKRVAVFIVSKSDFTFTTAFTETYTTVSAGSWSTSSKFVRYFGEIDGKHLFGLSPMNNSASSLSYYSFFAVSVPDSKVYSGTTASSPVMHTNANYNVIGSLSGLVPKAGTQGEFFTTVPGTNPSLPVTISKFAIPNEVTTSTSAVTVGMASGMARTNMTLVGMPDGVQLLPCCALNVACSSVFIPYITTGGNGKRYLNLLSTFNGAAAEETLASYLMANIGLFTFEIADDGTSLIYKSHTLGGFGYGLRINEFLSDDTGRTLLVANSTGFAVWTWSDVTNTYIKGEWRVVPAGLRRLHLDSAYKIWVEDLDNSVFVFDMDLSASVNITFDRAAVTYEGTTVPIKAYVDALSFAGSRIARNVRLVATGCTFDDGSVVKVVNTLTTGALEVPLFVNGGGNVSLNGYLL